MTHIDQDARRTAPQPTLQARKQELMRDAMWDAAIDLFALKGFDETTVDDIARAAGVSRRSFFRYFSSKNDLMAHGIVTYGTILTDAVAACPSTYSRSEILRAVVLQVARHSATQPRTRKIMEIAAKYPAAREAQAAKVSEVQDLVAEAFGKCPAIHPGDEMTAHVLAGLTLSVIKVTFRFWFAEEPNDIAVAADQVLETLHGLICEDRKPVKEKPHKPAALKRAAKRTKV